MTEADWLSCTDPREMLDFVFHQATVRKQTLFGVACCRYAWRLSPDEWFQQIVDRAERYADGLLAQKELRQIAAMTGIAFASSSRFGPAPWASTVLTTLFHWANKGTGIPDVHQCALLRDLFHPFRLVTLDPAWLKWNDGLIGTMAQVIYDERRFADLPILADALEESCCYNNDILDHCRSPEHHVRGCWVVDLLLAKE